MGAGSTIGGGRVSQSGAGSDQQSSPLRQQDSAGQKQDRGYQPPVPQQTPSDRNVEPADPNGGAPAPVESVEPEVPSEEPVQQVPGQPTPQQAPSE